MPSVSPRTEGQSIPLNTCSSIYEIVFNIREDEGAARSIAAFYYSSSASRS